MLKIYNHHCFMCSSCLHESDKIQGSLTEMDHVTVVKCAIVLFNKYKFLFKKQVQVSYNFIKVSSLFGAKPSAPDKHCQMEDFYFLLKYYYKSIILLVYIDTSI